MAGGASPLELSCAAYDRGRADRGSLTPVAYVAFTKSTSISSGPGRRHAGAFSFPEMRLFCRHCLRGNVPSFSLQRLTLRQRRRTRHRPRSSPSACCLAEATRLATDIAISTRGRGRAFAPLVRVARARPIPSQCLGSKTHPPRIVQQRPIGYPKVGKFGTACRGPRWRFGEC